MSVQSKISGTVITYNEEKNILRCLKSMKPVVDEIVVVDSMSKDATRDICLKVGQDFPVTFIENPFRGHIEQKNFAASKANFGFVLSLDADEELDNPLQEAILEEKKKGLQQAYQFNRLTSYCGKWVKHCGWYPDKKIRLFQKSIAHWGGENPHDRIILDEGVKLCHFNKGDIRHYSFNSIADHAKTANNFSERASQEALLKGKKANFLIDVLGNPFFTFIKKYFFQLGFLDGKYGLIICILSAHSNFLKYSKIWYGSRHQ